MDSVKVLCVDDEPHILEGLALQLRRGYDVHKATSGAEGLDVIDQDGPFAVVLSDMQMPAMDGAAFLSQVRRKAPDTVRMLLTGHADVKAAIAAVNLGQVFRFMTKPCSPDHLRLAFKAASAQHRLLTAERVLLEQTLKGSIKMLTDILSMSSPLAFGRATRIKHQVSELAQALDVQNRWQVEVAAMLSQLGSISLPEETAKRFYDGQELNPRQQAMVERMPMVTEELLANIPRLEPVRKILAEQGAAFDAERGETATPVGARILKIVMEFDELESRGLSVQLALDTMLGRGGRYDPHVLQTFVEIKGASAEQRVVHEIPAQEVRLGMVFADDVRLKTGTLLVARGYEVTQTFMEKMRNFDKGVISEPLRVFVKSE